VTIDKKSMYKRSFKENKIFMSELEEDRKWITFFTILTKLPFPLGSNLEITNKLFNDMKVEFEKKFEGIGDLNTFDLNTFYFTCLLLIFAGDGYYALLEKHHMFSEDLNRREARRKKLFKILLEYYKQIASEIEKKLITNKMLQANPLAQYLQQSSPNTKSIVFSKGNALKITTFEQLSLAITNLDNLVKEDKDREIVFETFRLLYAALSAGAMEFIEQGVNTKKGQRAKKPPRSASAIKETIKTRLKEHPRYNYIQAWGSYKRNHWGLKNALTVELDGSTYQVFYAENALVEIKYFRWTKFKEKTADDIDTNKHIGKDRFKKYFDEIRKLSS
jgi:hypothetical protein